MIPWVVTCALVGCTPPARPLVSEIFYDAIGDDTGLEFVELYNPGTDRADLTGARLEAGDGAAPGRWTLRWTAPPGTAIAPGGRFVIGGARVVPAPDAIVELQLQNGPDAVRVVWPDGRIEVVGYGALSDSEYFCGRPAVDVAAGASLARIPDDAELGENALDFHAAPPSPGGVNQPRRHADWIVGSLGLDPEQPDPGATALLRGRVRNVGIEAITAGELVARALAAAGDSVAELGRTIAGALAPSDTTSIEIPITLGRAGAVVVHAVLELVSDERPAPRDSVRIRVGPGPLQLTEIQFHPTHGEGEWIEVRNRAGEPVALESFRLSDRSGTRGVPGTRPACASDSFALFAQDPERLLQVYPALDTNRIARVHPWPSLNNTNDATGIADAIALRDTADLPCDHAAYSAANVPAGVPLERDDDGRWRPSLDPRGSPLAANPAPLPIRGRFVLARARLGAHEGVAHVGWSLPWPGRLEIDAYELDGSFAGRLLVDADAPARGERDLGVSPLGPGLHVLLLHAEAHSGETVDATQLLRMEGGDR